jgi:hypothetical protein
MYRACSLAAGGRGGASPGGATTWLVGVVAGWWLALCRCGWSTGADGRAVTAAAMPMPCRRGRRRERVRVRPEILNPRGGIGHGPSPRCGKARGMREAGSK